MHSPPFQCFTNDVLKDLLDVYVVVYLDDVLIYSEDIRLTHWKFSANFAPATYMPKLTNASSASTPQTSYASLSTLTV